MKINGLEFFFSNLTDGKVVNINDISYAIIEGALHWVCLSEDSSSYTSHPSEITFNEFLNQVECSHVAKENIKLLPLKLILDSSGEWDYTFTPRGACPRCFKPITAENVLKQGQFGHCPRCFRQLFKAPSIYRTVGEDRFETLEQMFSGKYGPEQGFVLFEAFKKSREDYLLTMRSPRKASIPEEEEVKPVAIDIEEVERKNADKPRRKVKFTLPY